jgi:hypothetical protein
MRRVLHLVSGIFLMGGVAIAPSISNAETPAQQPDASAKGSGDVPLSKKLDKSEGVIKPPQGVDPEIHQEPPAKTGDKMPVIIPPGEPGGDQSIQPK